MTASNTSALEVFGYVLLASVILLALFSYFGIFNRLSKQESKEEKTEVQRVVYLLLALASVIRFYFAYFKHR